ncbi:MAG: M24 family metallopeptidase [Deferribacterota bacterium]|nr:M24 family metallopeptidase [Deferribacterota bacterium]
MVKKYNLENELIIREERFRKNLSLYDSEWALAVFFDSLDIFYFTGTMQNGVFIIPRDSESLFFVKKSYDRAIIESPLRNIYPIRSFRQIKDHIKANRGRLYMHKAKTNILTSERFNKYFAFSDILALDKPYYMTRAVKSEYEIEMQKASGIILRDALEKFARNEIKEGISEFELGFKIYSYMVDRGHELITRSNNLSIGLFTGDVSFSENGCFYNAHDGPVGSKGLSTSAPFFGSKERLLRKGDTIIIDMVCNIGGYNTDKTIVYCLGSAEKNIGYEHEKCIEIEGLIVSMMKPGGIPANIYETIMNSLDKDFKINFMGYGSNQVKFLGHGIGLTVDEYPVIARSFLDPLEESMTLAVEPKKCVDNRCIVGSENTYLITKEGAISITGNCNKIIEL